MRRSRNCLLAVCLLLLGGLARDRAEAQANQDKPFDVKPFLPNIIPLPPNAQVTPGLNLSPPSPSDPTPITNPQTPNALGSGLRITIPTR